jgi:ABC-2 type transport system permease protein
LLLIFRMTSSGRPHAFTEGLAFPVGAGYALLVLSNLIYNSFGTDGTGIQFYFLSPVPVRDVLLAKNMVHTFVLICEMGFIWVAICFLYRPPSAAVAAATVTAVLFAAPVDFCAGNILSLYAPQKYDYAILGRQRAPNTTVLASFGVQAIIVGLAALALLAARYLGSLWVATAFFAALALVAFAIYHLVLQRVDGIALRRRETLIGELSRAS